MKRLIPATIILFVIIIMCIICNISVCRLIKSSEEEILKCEMLYSENDFEKAYDTAVKFKKKWINYAKIISAYSNHCPLDDISDLAAVLPEAIKYKNDFELKSVISRIRVTLDIIHEEQSFTLASLY